MRDEPWCAQLRISLPGRDRVGDGEDVEETLTVLLERGRRRQVRTRADGIDDEPLAGCRHEAPKRLETRVAPAVLVGGHHRLRRARPSCQRSLRETVPCPDGGDQLRRFHGPKYI
jgi:hypothetical protein